MNFYYFLLRMHFITQTKGIELCHFPWVFVKTFVTHGDVLMSDWCLLSCSFLLSCWFFFFSHSLFIFFYTKYHKLVWYMYRKRNFIRMQHYSFAIFPFDYGHDVSDYKYLVLCLWGDHPKAEFVSLSSSLMLCQKDLDSLPNISCKKKV